MGHSYSNICIGNPFGHLFDLFYADSQNVQEQQEQQLLASQLHQLELENENLKLRNTNLLLENENLLLKYEILKLENQ